MKDVAQAKPAIWRFTILVLAANLASLAPMFLVLPKPNPVYGVVMAAAIVVSVWLSMRGSAAAPAVRSHYHYDAFELVLAVCGSVFVTEFAALCLSIIQPTSAALLRIAMDSATAETISLYIAAILSVPVFPFSAIVGVELFFDQLYPPEGGTSGAYRSLSRNHRAPTVAWLLAAVVIGAAAGYVALTSTGALAFWFALLLEATIAVTTLLLVGQKSEPSVTHANAIEAARTLLKASGFDVQDSPQLSESVDSPLLATVDLVGLRGPEVLLLELATSEESSEIAEWTTASRLPAAASAIRAARRTSDSAAALEIDCVIALVGIGAARSLRSFAAREGVRIAEIPTDAIATIVSTETPQKLAELSERYLGLRPLAVARDEGQVA